MALIPFKLMSKDKISFHFPNNKPERRTLFEGCPDIINGILTS
jgi:hypothetical protein